jgi:hypothetical protein
MLDLKQQMSVPLQEEKLSVVKYQSLNGASDDGNRLLAYLWA